VAAAQQPQREKACCDLAYYTTEARSAKEKEKGDDSITHSYLPTYPPAAAAAAGIFQSKNNKTW